MKHKIVAHPYYSGVELECVSCGVRLAVGEPLTYKKIRKNVKAHKALFKNKEN